MSHRVQYFFCKVSTNTSYRWKQEYMIINVHGLQYPVHACINIIVSLCHTMFTFYVFGSWVYVLTFILKYVVEIAVVENAGEILTHYPFLISKRKWYMDSFWEIWITRLAELTIWLHQRKHPKQNGQINIRYTISWLLELTHKCLIIPLSLLVATKFQLPLPSSNHVYT